RRRLESPAMVHESLDSAHGLYAIGAVVLILGIVAAVAGSLIKRRLEEEHRDERYVRERRGEGMVAVEPPRIATLLQYAGFARGASRSGQDRGGDGVRLEPHRRAGAVGDHRHLGARMQASEDLRVPGRHDG